MDFQVRLTTSDQFIRVDCSNLVFFLKKLSDQIGATHIKITAYHPIANDMVEHFQHHLRAAIHCAEGSITY